MSERKTLATAGAYATLVCAQKEHRCRRCRGAPTDSLLALQHAALPCRDALPARLLGHLFKLFGLLRFL